jgi:hypothetical protein
LEPPKPSIDAELSPLRLRTVDHTIAVISSAMTANDPPITATQNHGDLRGRGGTP